MSPLTDEQREALNEELRQLAANRPSPRVGSLAVRLALGVMLIAGVGAGTALLASLGGRAPGWVGTLAGVLGLVAVGAFLAIGVLGQLSLGNMGGQREVFRRHLGRLTREEQEAFFLSQLK